MYTIGKPLKCGVYWFWFYKNRFVGSKYMTKKTKNWGIFGKSHFFDQKSLNWSNLVKTFRNSLLFFVKFSK
jgi:hypothetical protein